MRVYNPSATRSLFSYFQSIFRPTTTTTRPEFDTYFSRADRKFPPLSDQGKIPTEGFLHACEAIGDFTGNPYITFFMASFTKNVCYLAKWIRKAPVRSGKLCIVG